MSNSSKRKAPIGRSVKRNADAEYPFQHCEVINYTLDGVSIHPVTTNIQLSFLTQLPERKETAQGFHHEANGDFNTVTELNNTVTELNGCDRRKLRMDPQHCTYSMMGIPSGAAV